MFYLPLAASELVLRLHDTYTLLNPQSVISAIAMP